MRTLGLDLGTNSIGWAVVESVGRRVSLVDKGVYLFPKGVGENKSGEYPLAAQRTGYRSARRLIMRRRWRKQATLETLVKHDLCSGLTTQDVKNWKQDRHKYPANEVFKQWLNIKAETPEGKPAGPYYCRWRCATEQLNLSLPEDRYCLGRAIYHLAQRRGYKSNRISGEEKDGAVNAEIAKLDVARGSKTLGQYFYEECLGKEPVRGSQHYTSRAQYEQEFTIICTKQALPADLTETLRYNLFMQRPLRSQKGTVGKCLFEPTKARAADSHPLTERFRQLQIVNNIRVASPGETEMRALTTAERESALAWLQKQSGTVNFDKLARALTPRKVSLIFGSDEKRCEVDINAWRFNYRGDSGLPGSPFIARMIKLFGPDWVTELHKNYAKAGKKTIDQVVDDIWHAIFSFDDEQKLKMFGIEQLGLDEEKASIFAKPLPSGYGRLSLAAMRRIIPFLEKGAIYSHAVFMAKLPDILKRKGIDWEKVAGDIEQAIRSVLDCHEQSAWSEKVANSLIKTYRENHEDPAHLMITEATKLRFMDQIESVARVEAGASRWEELPTDVRKGIIEKTAGDILHWASRREGFVAVKRLDERVKDMLIEQFGLLPEDIEGLYHPSEVESYKAAEKDHDGVLQLGSPRIDSIRNPVFMRAMFQLRKLINTMLKEGVIDGDTRIRIEMARELNTANMRAAIERDQRERQKERDRIRSEIASLPCSPATVTDRDILKYMLWEEQDRRCLYTGATIEVSAFLGDNPAYDIEHTMPRSRRLDNSRANLTLCDRHFNRTVKRNRLPAELPQAEKIQQRVNLLWDEKIETLQKSVEKRKASSRSVQDKVTKDKIRQRLHYEQIQLSYLKTKRKLFLLKDVPEGFTNSQLVDTRIICKYAMEYLKTAFPKVYSVKAGAVNAVKEIWGLDEKFRGDHVHHAIDAIVTACLSPSWYAELAAYYHEYERYLYSKAKRPEVPQPWSGFDRDLNEKVSQELLVVHYSPDNLLKQTKKVVRRRGKIVRENGKPRYAMGDSARGSLHQDTIYAKIKDPSEQKNGESGSLKAVVRRTLDKNFKEKDLRNIVDKQIQAKVMAQKEKLKKGKTIWFDESNRIPIRKVRCYASNKADSLIELNAHRDQSAHVHKQRRYAANDGNYITALYRGMIKGKLKPDWKVANNFDAIQARKTGDWETILPEIDENGLTRRHILKKNTLVIFKRTEDEDLTSLSQMELSRRLYRVTVLERERIKAMHHRCGQPDKEIEDTSSKIDFDGSAPSNMVRLSVNTIHIAVAGADFTLDPMGHIHWQKVEEDA